MKRRLFWKLSATIVIGTILLFWILHTLMLHTEQHMSFIAQEHQQTLRDYAKKAEMLYDTGDVQGLSDWIKTIQAKEDTWVAVVKSDLRPLAGSYMLQSYMDRFILGRDITWKIHLYFKENPVMDISFADKHTHFMIQLPQRMRPGNYWFEASLLLQIALPMFVMVLLSFIIYRHVVSPLRQLEKATHQFSEGNFKVRPGISLGTRNDEIATLARTFDAMAERIGNLIDTQRHLTADLSHELRTPLTRIELALSWAEQSANDKQPLERIREECQHMRELAEDTLTLAWLENEQPVLRDETLDLVDLIDSIVDNARFEFPKHQIDTQLPQQAVIHHSSGRALGHAIENILRNALKQTPVTGTTQILLNKQDKHYQICIDDQGPGVAELYLQEIFKPFFRVPQQENQYSGYGVGLSLAKRQIEATGGTLSASNLPTGGLRMCIQLPC